MVISTSSGPRASSRRGPKNYSDYAILQEYAVEPKALSTWSDFRYFVNSFGNGQGRLISKYPDAWPRLVWESCAETSPINRRRVEEGLVALRNRLLKTKRDYDETMGWLENAAQAHKSEPFHAIIASSSSECSETIVAGELSDDSPLWKVARDGQVPRQAQAMAVLTESLLFHSSEVFYRPALRQHQQTWSAAGGFP